MTKQALLSENISLKKENSSLKFRLEQLQKLVFGSKNERFVQSTNEEQLELFQSDQELIEPIAEVEQISYDRTKKNNHPGRNSIPDHLPVEEEVLEPEGIDVLSLEKIGEEVTETLKYTPASLIKKRIIRPKYIDRKNAKIHIAKCPDQALPKCMADSSLLAHILVGKFVDHLPFYRQLQIIKRDYQVELACSTVNDWFISVCTLLKPLYEIMVKQVISSDYIQVDESPIKVQDTKKKRTTHQGYQWVYSSPQNGLVIFQYRKGRGMHGPKEMLNSYQGYLQCDGYKVYDKIGQKKGITLVGCWAHARRKFYEAQDNDKQRSEYALSVIQQIYAHERKMANYDSKQRLAYRTKHVKPIIENFKTYLTTAYLKVLPKSTIGKAISYSLNQWAKLENILLDGRLQIDNNLIENKIRPLALGRKNYLFAGSHQAAQRIAMMYSFFATCKQNGVNPYTWLQNTIDKIPDTKISQIRKLIPQV